MATFAYGRCSTAEQTTENQRLEIQAAGHAIDYWFADTISGKSSASERPQFQAMLVRISVIAPTHSGLSRPLAHEMVLRG